MREYRVHGGFKRGTAVLLAAGFLLGSSITALAAGEGMSMAYGKAAEVTAEKVAEVEGIEAAGVSMSDEDILREFARAYDLDPEDVVIVGEEGIETIGDFININWNIPAGKTFMTMSFNENVGDSVIATTSGDPSDIKYQMGVKDPKDLMRYVEGTGYMSHQFKVEKAGGHCFFVTNLGSRELNVEGSVIK